MSYQLVLDTSPLSEVIRRPGQSIEADACRHWLRAMIAGGAEVYVPEIADYEVLRELVRLGNTASIVRLNTFLTTTEYLPITTEAMRLAADLWAQARNGGWATADPKALDGDVILSAQALTLPASLARLVIVTQNVAHLSRYVMAQEWQNILS